MEDMASLWSYQESFDVLKHKLLQTTLELESVRVEASEEMRKNKEYVKHLLQLLKNARQERDEAKDQLQKLLAKVMHSNASTDLLSNNPQLQPQSPPLLKNSKANSSISESTSLSETYNYQSHNSSPVDSFFDTVSSPELSNINMGDSGNIAIVNQPLGWDFSGLVSNHLVSSALPKIHQASLAIDNLVKGKTLPQKGKLLQAVLDAGPLLQTLLVAGPLPRWRNPPPLQPFQIPPVSIKGCEPEILSQKPAANFSQFIPRSLNSQSFIEMPCSSSQVLPTSMLNFARGDSVSCLNSERLTPVGANSNFYIPDGKIQRLQ